MPKNQEYHGISAYPGIPIYSKFDGDMMRNHGVQVCFAPFFREIPRWVLGLSYFLRDTLGYRMFVLSIGNRNDKPSHVGPWSFKSLPWKLTVF